MQINQFVKLEKDSQLTSAQGRIGNYDIYQSLGDGVIEIIIHSLLDDSIFTANHNNQNMPQSCKKIFENIDELYQHIQKNICDEQMLSVSDIGHLNIIDVLQRKGKTIKLECVISCFKVGDIYELNKYYLKIIKILRPKQAQKNYLLKEERGSIKMKNSSLIKEQRQIKKTALFLSIDVSNNPYLACFNKTQNQIQIHEFSLNRLKLYFNQSFPKDRCYFVKFKIIRLKNQAFALGIIDKHQQRKITRSRTSISFQFASGQIKDTNKNKYLEETIWHKAGITTNNLNGKVLKMQVNTLKQSVSFYRDDELVGETIITDYLMGKEITPYVSCKHQGDKFLINVE